ncbi:hypothetical protein MKW98_031377 [Papaver atlanticum]|uniref:Uncharacterized protein n=1 Tax=Papaver atlanticum TaxID=357466 RepID=A0AAD4S596_9MAGN|nr:hypothetical protein MKW98_031377 [Papaver atlanticum]
MGFPRHLGMEVHVAGPRESIEKLISEALQIVDSALGGRKLIKNKSHQKATKFGGREQQPHTKMMAPSSQHCKRAPTLSIACGCGIFRKKWEDITVHPSDTNENHLGDKPIAFTYKEWKDLVKFWITEEHQVLSDRNIKNNSDQKSKAHNGQETLFPMQI